MLLALSVNFFGIGEFWSGVIVGVVGLPIVILVGVGISEAWTSWALRNYEPSEGEPDDFYPRRNVTGGVLVCDYVDVDLLQTIAQQKGVDPEPAESEKGREVTKEGSVGLERIPVAGRFGRKTSESERERFQHRTDHNILLSSVLDAFNPRELGLELSQIPDVSLGSPTVLDELASMAEQHSEAETARDALISARGRLVEDAKINEFKAAATSNAFVLAEGHWSILREGESVILTLKSLTSRLYPMYGPDRTETINMPEGLAITARFAEVGMTSQGESRLDGAEQMAGVFGVATKAEGGTLVLTPAAVFGRFGLPAPPESPRGPGVGYPAAC